MSLFSLKFIAFIAVLVLLYFILPKKCQWVVLLAANVVFYLAGGLHGTLFIVVTIISQYLLALILDLKNSELAQKLAADGTTSDDKKALKKKFSRVKKFYLLIAVIINLGILCFLKYANPFINEFNDIMGLSIKQLDIIIPIGLSYYTFKSVGYVIDVYRGRVKAERNILKLALFISYFPALVQGPIDRYEDLAPQLTEPHKFSYQRFIFGAQRMLWGYIKKLVIADRIAVIVNEVIGNYSTKGYVGFTIFIGCMLYAFQIYADFSGGMDIVVGLSEIFGIKLTENFQRPFFSTSVSEYWRRWHITLGAWFKNYVFYPLSLSKLFNKIGKRSKKILGDKVGKLLAPSLASFVSFVLIGIWHGVGWKYVLYGFYMAVFVSSGTLLEDFYEKCRDRFGIKDDSKGWHLFQMFRTYLIITMSRFVNLAKDVPDFINMFKATFTNFNPWVLFDGSLYNLGLDRKNFQFMLLSILVLLAVDYVKEKGVNIRETLSKTNIVVRWIVYYAAIFTLLIFGMYGPGYDAASFIYQRF